MTKLVESRKLNKTTKKKKNGFSPQSAYRLVGKLIHSTMFYTYWDLNIHAMNFR